MTPFNSSHCPCGVSLQPDGLFVRGPVHSTLLFCDLGRVSQAFARRKQLGNSYWINIFDFVPISIPLYDFTEEKARL